MDFAGPFNGGMFLIVVDAKSKWMKVIQMSSGSTSANATIIIIIIIIINFYSAKTIKNIQKRFTII